MDIIKSYLGTHGEFADAYSRLKERYQEYYWNVDALELVADGEEFLIDGVRIAEPLDDYFELVVCENASMKIAEREKENC